MLPLTLPTLRLLSDGNFHSGEELATQLGVSRASIWNALQGVDSLGVRLFKVRGRGYQLANYIDWLDAAQVALHLGAHANRLQVRVSDVVGSTNALMMQSATQETAHANCLAAEFQTHGRGRRGRVWHAGLGGALTFSLLWRFDLGAAQLSGLSLAIGVALARAMRELGAPNVQLKWPNDLLHGYQKLGGVLIELQGDALGPSATVIGVGINLRLDDNIRNQIDQAVVDLTSLCPDLASRNQVLAVTLRHMVDVLDVFETQGFGVLREEWEVLHAYQGKSVSLRMPDGSQFSGKVTGVTGDGVLILETSSGERRFGSGEISLRPIANAGKLGETA